MPELYTPVTWSSIHAAITPTGATPTSPQYATNIYVPSVITPSYREQYIRENYPTTLATGYQQAQGVTISAPSMAFYSGASGIAEQIRRGIPEASARISAVHVVGAPLAYGTRFTSESVARLFETGGMIPGGVEVIAQRPAIFPTAVRYGVEETIGSTWEGLQREPGQVISDIAVSGLLFKGLGRIPRPKVPYKLGSIFGESRAIREYRTMMREPSMPFLKTVDIASYNRMVAENIKPISRLSMFGKMFGVSKRPTTLEVWKVPTPELHNLLTGEKTVFMQRGAAYLVGRAAPMPSKVTGFIKRGATIEEYNKMVAERLKPPQIIELGKGATITGRPVNVMEYLMVGGQRITPSFRPRVGGFRPKLLSARISRLATQRLRGRPGRSMFRFGEGRFMPIIIPRVRGGQLSLPSEAISSRAGSILGERSISMTTQTSGQIFKSIFTQKQEKAILTSQIQISQSIQKQIQRQTQRSDIGKTTRPTFAPTRFHFKKPRIPKPSRGLPESDYGRKGGLLGFGEVARIRSAKEILRGL